VLLQGSLDAHRDRSSRGTDTVRGCKNHKQLSRSAGPSVCPTISQGDERRLDCSQAPDRNGSWTVFREDLAAVASHRSLMNSPATNPASHRSRELLWARGSLTIVPLLLGPPVAASLVTEAADDGKAQHSTANKGAGYLAACRCWPGVGHCP
jgi:hypothetical protein